jgi:capsular polysaccharide biosynthesis protein
VERMASPLILPFVTEDAYAQWAGAPQMILYEAERVEGGAPVVFPQPEPDFYDVTPLGYDFPAVTLTTLRDIVVRGNANILTPPEAILRHQLFNPATEVVPEESSGRLFFIGDRSSGAWKPTDSFDLDDLPEAAVFTDGTSPNYAHWITEVLPRLAAFVRDGAHAGVPLILDTDLHPNIMRSVALVAGADAILYRLARDQQVRVGVLHNVSPTGYVPFRLRPHSLDTVCHGLFGPQALRQAVNQLRRGIGTGPSYKTRPKLFLRRNSTLRHIVNEAEVEEALVARGFVVVEPERLTFDEQVAVYSGAGMIVGATGAAMANLVFCPPDCPTVVMMPKFRHTAYWYWRRMAAAAGAGPVVHVSGEQIDPTEDPYHALAVHADFAVELKDVLDAVDAADALRG